MSQTPLLAVDPSEIAPSGMTPAQQLQAIMAQRRSIRRLHDGPFTPATQERLLRAVQLTPAAYNMPPWRVVLVHEQREALWEEIAAGFAAHLDGERLARYQDRLAGFRPGVAVGLIFEDLAVGQTLREDKGASPELALHFVQQALGMVQLSLWLALTAEGLASSLQHWDDLVGERVARFAGLPPDQVRLAAIMPIGYAAEEPKVKILTASEQRCVIDATPSPNGAVH